MNPKIIVGLIEDENKCELQLVSVLYIQHLVDSLTLNQELANV